MSPRKREGRGKELSQTFDASSDRTGKAGRTSRDLPTKSLECGLFHGVSDDLSILEKDESVRGSESEGRRSVVGGDGHELLEVLGAARRWKGSVQIRA